MSLIKTKHRHTDPVSVSVTRKLLFVQLQVVNEDVYSPQDQSQKRSVVWTWSGFRHTFDHLDLQASAEPPASCCLWPHFVFNLKI